MQKTYTESCLGKMSGKCAWGANQLESTTCQGSQPDPGWMKLEKHNGQRKLQMNDEPHNGCGWPQQRKTKGVPWEWLGRRSVKEGEQGRIFLGRAAPAYRKVKKEP